MYPSSVPGESVGGRELVGPAGLAVGTGAAGGRVLKTSTKRSPV